MSEILVASGLVKSYRSATRTIEVLRGLDLSVSEGESVAVVGDSGVGKSTLLHVLGGLDHPDAGEVRFRGTNIFADGPKARAAYRNRSIGFVFQFHHLLPEFSALENVEMPFRIGGRLGGARETSRAILERIGLGERLHHRPSALSGGEQQRVAIARAVAPGPAIVLADEPTGNLDPATGAEVFRMFRELQSTSSFALIVATHSGRIAGGCDRVLRLDDGRLRPIGDREARDFFEGVARRGGASTML